MKKSSILPIALLVSLAVFSGCETTSTDDRYVDSQGTETLVGGNQITITDFYMAADEMVNSLVNSGVLDRAPRQPAILGISNVYNDTREQFDTDLLVKKIRVGLNQTGKVLTRTTYGAIPEDEKAAEEEAKRKFKGESAPDNTPNFTLSGKIIQPALVKERSTRQNSYIFQLTLTEIGSGGLAVWEDEKIITKQFKKATIGW